MTNDEKEAELADEAARAVKARHLARGAVSEKECTLDSLYVFPQDAPALDRVKAELTSLYEQQKAATRASVEAIEALQQFRQFRQTFGV